MNVYIGIGWWGKTVKERKKLRITVRVSSSEDWVDNDVINENG